MVSRHASHATLLVLLAAGAAALPRPARGGEPVAYSVTIRGGVSLGAHEAGVTTYALSAIGGANNSRLRIVTGASAGSLNALLAVLGSCAGLPAEPDRSLAWNTWIPVGFEQLLVPDAVGPLGAFSRAWLLRGAAGIEAAWIAGLPEACDVVLGVAVTRSEPLRAPFAGGRVELPSMEEKFAIRVRGRGPGRPPRVTNYAGRGGATERLLVTGADGEIAFEAIRDLVLASMAFPVAFPPQPLATCDAREVATPDVCGAAEATTARYVDGGIFDNAPVRLAVAIARTGLAQGADGGLDWRPAPDPGQRQVPEDLVFSFLDPEATEYPPARVEAASRGDSITAELAGLLSGVVDSARAKELSLLLEEEPAIAGRVLLPRRHFPAASAPVFAFLGFFETEFRKFDFTLGMYDARRMLEANHAEVAPRWPEEAGGPAWAAFGCMRAVYDGLPSADRTCAGDALGDFRALLQVSLDQLYDRCRAAGGDGAWRNPHCARAARGEPPPRVPGLAPRRWPAWRQGRGETELAWSMRLLGSYGFRFQDLGVPPGRGDLAVDRIRSALGRAADLLAAAQPRRERAAVAFAARIAADLLSYAPPGRVLHLTMGPTATELGLSRSFHGSSWFPRRLRLAGAVGARGLEAVLSTGSAQPFALLATGGVELQPPLGSGLARLRFGLRGGWVFAKDDGYGAGSCADRGRSGVSACSRPVVQVLASTALLERFRIQLVGEWYPRTAYRAELWSVAPGIGLELGF